MNTKIDSKIGAIIGISIFAGLAGAFGYWEYEQVSGLEQEKSTLWSKIGELNSSVEGWKAAHEEKELLIQGLVEEKNTLYSENSNLQSRINKLTSEVSRLSFEKSTLQSQYDGLQAKYRSLSGEAYQLKQSSTTLKQQIQDLINQLTEQEQQDLIAELKLSQQTQEVIFYRQLGLYNYKTSEQWNFYWNIPFKTYYYYRSNPDGHNIPYIGTDESITYYQTSLKAWRDLTKLADFLRQKSGSDDELFANLALQVTHQFFYKVTENTKFPIETFVEGSGDCDTLAVFAAALMKAGGLDTVVVTAWVKGTEEDKLGLPHAMVGVNLEEEPNDHGRGGWYIDYDNRRYYLAEATWSDVFTAPWNYKIQGTAVGDNPWGKFDTVAVVRAPN